MFVRNNTTDKFCSASEEITVVYQYIVIEREREGEGPEQRYAAYYIHCDMK